MDLWIKAQSGRLSKVEDIMQPIEDEFDSVSSWVLYARSKCDAMFPLGFYESEERAMEVLKEIKRHIAFLNVEMGAGRFGELDFESDVVFEMPEK